MPSPAKREEGRGGVLQKEVKFFLFDSKCCILFNTSHEIDRMVIDKKFRKEHVVKKILRVVLVMLFVTCMAVPGFAAKAESKKASEQKFERIVAEVVTLDVTAKTIVVKEEKTGASRTIKISAKAAAQLKAGDRVRIKLKAGTDESAGVRVIKGEPKADMAVETPATTAAEPQKK